ncbi:hypothetical protein L1987_09951 [Smallanthus sonchifolius]|uniref:Uncharacterized protein n=1 Tax=Smallanthus sonchifolius TaxID=185202 RepID=A0ACB9JQW9_9ASTR|nr:hypothetical protein L1987_09951 [Smallanthus sonchifolius]
MMRKSVVLLLSGFGSASPYLRSIKDMPGLQALISGRYVLMNNSLIGLPRFPVLPDVPLRTVRQPQEPGKGWPGHREPERKLPATGSQSRWSGKGATRPHGKAVRITIDIITEVVDVNA